MQEETFTAHRRDTGEEVEFVVGWPEADDSKLIWRWDAEHNAFPATPLSVDLGGGRLGIARALIAMGGEPPPDRGVSVHGYRYALVGGAMPPESSTRRLRETLAELSPQLDQLWFKTWRPQIEAEARQVWLRDYAALSWVELVEVLGDLPEIVANHADLMFRARNLVTFSRTQLVEFCAARFDGDPEDLVNGLLRGVENVSLDSGADLWTIAQGVKQRSGLLDLIRLKHPTEAEIGSVEGGTEFHAAMSEWLDKYGRRNGSFAEIAEPSWIEDWTVPLGLVAGYLDIEDPRAAQKPAIEQREDLTAKLEAALFSGEERQQFRELHQAALPYLAVRESRPFALAMSRASFRMPVLEAGRRLTERGILAEPSDIFFLSLEEIRSVDESQSGETRSMIEDRHRDYDYWRNIVPPAEIGGQTASQASTPGELAGIAASAGKARGSARVVMTLDQAAGLQPGEILVTRSTTPLWTPLFAIAAAVVTDGGGILSHCAIVAREYGIPAVVGTKSATHQIRSGSDISVDGTEGVVHFSDGK